MRVVWTSSNAAELFAPKGGIVVEDLDYEEDKGQWYKYGVSKAGNVYHASEFARRFGGEGIVSVVSTICSFIDWLELDLRFPILFIRKKRKNMKLIVGIWQQSLNPGGLKTDLQRHVPWYVNIWLVSPLIPSFPHKSTTHLTNPSPFFLI